MRGGTRSLEPPRRPVGAKLELTYNCNLRCGFCYTDSPRRTLEGSIDLPDEKWLGVIDELIALGATEATVTGGEPLLRAQLALELLERMAAAGMAVHLNTNGWFVDEAMADRLAAIPGLTAHISVDGPAPSIHDAARGVPGSWRRVIDAIDRLLVRGIPVRVAHVVTPGNAAAIAEFLDQMWTLGVELVTLTPVVPVGAASRDAGWRIGRREIERAVRSFRATHPDGMSVHLQTGALELLSWHEDVPPRTMLVRPNGAVQIDSVRPFTFGSVDDGLEACWRAIAAAWADPRIKEWAAGIGRATDVPKSDRIPYTDEELPIAGEPVPAVAGRRRSRGRLLAPPERSTLPPADLDEARSQVLERALRRRYRQGPVRFTDADDSTRYVHARDRRRTCTLNRTAALIMDACSAGDAHGAVAALREAHPDLPGDRAVDDVLAGIRRLLESGVIEPGGSARTTEIAASTAA